MGYLSPPTFTLLHSVRFPDWGGWRTTRWPTIIDQTLRHSLPRVISQARLNLSECHRDCALCIAVSRCTLPYIWFLLFCHLSLRMYCFVGLIIVVIKLSQRSRSSLQSDVIFLVRLQEKFEIDFLGSERVKLGELCCKSKWKTSRTNWGQLTCTFYSDSKTDIPEYLRTGRHFVSRNFPCWSPWFAIMTLVKK